MARATSPTPCWGRATRFFGTAILGANYSPNGGGESFTYSASSTFDFAHRGDLVLGVIDNQRTGFTDSLGFQSMQFSILDNGAEISARLLAAWR
jgi:hypothetical protein